VDDRLQVQLEKDSGDRWLVAFAPMGASKHKYVSKLSITTVVSTNVGQFLQYLAHSTPKKFAT